MERTPLLTIYSPTYNRKKELARLFDSLLKQSCHDFVFLVVDDGSTDGTAEMVKSWSAPFEVRYLYKENGGVHTARDTAYHACDTELIVGIDSDDWLKPEAVESILETWDGKSIGIIMPSESTEGELLSPPMPDKHSATFQEFNFGMKCAGEHAYVLKSEIIKSIPDAPVFTGEKLVPEGWKLIQLPEEPLVIMKESVRVCEYLDTGYTSNIKQVRKKNIHGFRAQYLMYFKKIHYPIPKLKNLIKYCVSFIIA